MPVHPSITILSAAASVYYIFDTRPLCINFDTHVIKYVPVACHKGRLLIRGATA